MKLEKYENKTIKKRKTLLISLGVIVLASISFLLYKTFASFTESAEFSIMNGKVDYFGNSDVYFVFYKDDDQLLEEMPQKDNEENLVFDHGDCDNGASIEWNESEWAPLVKGLNNVKTKCSLYFKEAKGTPLVDYITELAKTDTTNLMADDTAEKNIRYIAYNYSTTTTKNYIDIGDRTTDGQPILWRIIGVMNNTINVETNKQENLVKIVRADNIGDYSWDTSASTINNGWGVNEWSEADLMKLLNPGYETNKLENSEGVEQDDYVNNSLYWDNKAGNCYKSKNNETKSCDFTSSGLSETAKNKIAKVRWYTGTFATYTWDGWTAKATYEAERGSHNGKEACLSAGGGDYCNDTVPRTTTWDGYIGLINLSDFGYAPAKNYRDKCFTQSMSSYKSGNCGIYNWIKPNSLSANYYATINPMPKTNPYNSASYFAFIHNEGYVTTFEAEQALQIYPSAYLKSSVKILPNDNYDTYGSIDNPFIVS